jgi:hypothetical protein
MNIRNIVNALSVSLLLASAALAQVNTASLTGLIKDSSDAVVAGAKVPAQNVSTGAERSTETNREGYYFLPDLPVGVWDISVEKTGFHKAMANITLDATEKGRQDFSLAVGTVASITNVEASASLLSTEDPSIGTLVENKYVSEYPLLLRSWDDLVNLVAGIRCVDRG